MTCIGLISDTHVPNRLPAIPSAVFEHLDGVDLILHAGDVDDPAILGELRKSAPVMGVRGNWHLLAGWPNDHCLPLFLDLQIEGQHVILTHGHLGLWTNFVEKFWLFVPNCRRRVNDILVKRLARRFTGADVYVFVHTHRPLVERRDGALFINPGAVCPARGQFASMGRLTITAGRAEAQIIPLD